MKVKPTSSWWRIAISRWYRGEYIPPSDDGIMRPRGRYRRHWTAKLVHSLVDFWHSKHDWIIGFLVSIILAVVYAMK
jgi:hypothetical protein